MGTPGDSKDDQLHSLISIIKDTGTSQKTRDFAYHDLLVIVQPQVRSQLDRYCRRLDHDRSQAESLATQAVWDAVKYFNPDQGIFTHLLARFLQRRLTSWLVHVLKPDRAGYKTVSIDRGEDHSQDRLNYMADPDSHEDRRQHDERDDFLKCWRRLSPRLTDIERTAILEVYGNGMTYTQAAKKLPRPAYHLPKSPRPEKRIDNAIARAKLKARDLGFDLDQITKNSNKTAA